MKPQLRRVGTSQSPIVIIDEFTGDVGAVAAIADTLAPFPRVPNYYPGVRRIIRHEDVAANEYVDRLCRDTAQFIAGAFEVDGFNLLEASFSIVTAQPGELEVPQRAPHFDSTDPKYYALLHYLRVPEGTGTAFYRQRSTGIERVTDANADRFVNTARLEMPQLPHDSGYILGSNQFFEEIGSVEAIPDRLVIYQGSLLHSGIVPPGMILSADPREGRLTANIFVHGQ